MRWFGPAWDAPVCDDREHVETPVGQRCEDCGGEIAEGDQGLVLAYWDGSLDTDEHWKDFPVHLDCLLAMVGVGDE